MACSRVVELGLPTCRSDVLAVPEHVLDPLKQNEVVESVIPPEGLLLSPGRIYLVNTLETMGSTK